MTEAATSAHCVLPSSRSRAEVKPGLYRSPHFQRKLLRDTSPKRLRISHFINDWLIICLHYSLRAGEALRQQFDISVKIQVRPKSCWRNGTALPCAR